MQIQTQTALMVAGGIWLLILSIAFYLQAVFFSRLTKGSKENELKKVLEKILDSQEDNSKSIKELDQNLKIERTAGESHIQKVGLIRFNPFREIGGDHSFSIAFLDDRDNGVVFTALHTRERTRVYAKEVRLGKTEAELSLEEKKALEKAKKRVN